LTHGDESRKLAARIRDEKRRAEVLGNLNNARAKP